MRLLIRTLATPLRKSSSKLQSRSLPWPRPFLLFLAIPTLVSKEIMYEAHCSTLVLGILSRGRLVCAAGEGTGSVSNRRLRRLFPDRTNGDEHGGTGRACGLQSVLSRHVRRRNKLRLRSRVRGALCRHGLHRRRGEQQLESFA